MRWLFLIPFLCAFSPVSIEHEDQAKTDREFANLYSQAQSRQFKVMNSTPNLADLYDGECVILSSNTFHKFLFRDNQEIYAVNVSCVTVRR